MQHNLSLVSIYLIDVIFCRYPRPSGSGFTAVILTYNRVQSLFHILRKLEAVPSLTRSQLIFILFNCCRKDSCCVNTLFSFLNILLDFIYLEFTYIE